MSARLLYFIKVAIAFAFAIGLGFVLHAAVSYLFYDIGWWALALWAAFFVGYAVWYDWKHGFLFNRNGGDTEP